MDHQYSIINECLRLVKQSHLPTSSRLRVEIQLIQIKRLLLNSCISGGIKSEGFGQSVFEGLLTRIRIVCSEDGSDDALAEVIRDFVSILAGFGSQTVIPATPLE